MMGGGCPSIGWGWLDELHLSNYNVNFTWMHFSCKKKEARCLMLLFVENRKGTYPNVVFSIP